MSDDYAWPCGCKTWREGDTFKIEPCGPSDCPVFRIGLDVSVKNGNVIIVKRLV